MTQPAFPDVLKKANWDKQKGVIAKLIKSETGIGASLDELFVSYNAVPWAKLDDKLAANVTTAAQGKALFVEGRAILNGQIDTLRKKCIDLKRDATKTAEGFKNPLLKSAKDYLTKMGQGAVDFSVVCRDTAIETLKKFEVLEKHHQDEALEIAKYVQARTDAANKIAKELVNVGKDETQVKIAVAHGNELMNNITTGKGAAAPTAAEIRKTTTSVGTLLKTAKQRYTTLQNDPDVGLARLGGGAGTDRGKAVAAQSGAVWTKGSNDFVAINQAIAFIEQSFTTLETLADHAEAAAGTSTKSDADFIAIAKSTLTELQQTEGDIRLAHTRTKEVPDKMEEYLEGALKKTLDLAVAKKSAILRREEGLKRVAQIQGYERTVDSHIARLKSIPEKLRGDPSVKAAIAKANTLKAYALTCISSGQAAIASSAQTEAKINALK